MGIKLSCCTSNEHKNVDKQKIILTNISKLVNDILCVDNIEGGILNLNHTIRECTKAVDNTQGDYLDEATRLLFTVQKYKYDIIEELRKRSSNPDADFNEVLEICYIRKYPDKGNKISLCHPNLAKLIQMKYNRCIKEVPIGTFLIHTTKSGLNIRVKVYPHPEQQDIFLLNFV